MAQSKTVRAATGKSKVIKAGTFPGVRGGKMKMVGKGSAKPAKKR